MESDLTEVELGDIGEFANGANFSQEDYGPGYPIVNVKQLYGGRFIDLHDLESLNKNVLKRPERLFLREGDILFARSSVKRSGSGQCAMVPEGVAQTIFSGFIIRLRLNDSSKTNPMFLNYLLQSPKYREIFSRIATGTAIHNLSQDALKHISVRLPSKAVQDEVTMMLGKIDDRITLLRQSNKSLEAIARTLFTSWFVSFDPVRAKAQDHEPEGMDAPTAALFPSEFQELNGSSVPIGWIEAPLDSIATFLNGIALQKYPAVMGEDSLPAIKIAQLRCGSAEGADRISPALPPQYLIRDGDLLFSWSGSLEVEIWCGGDGALNQHLFKVTSDTYPQWFIYFWLREHLAHFREIAESKVTTMGHIQRHHLKEALVAVPPTDTIQKLGETIEPLLNRAIQSRLQMSNLAELRDMLLPRLISGKLRVPEAEKMVEAVL